VSGLWLVALLLPRLAGLLLATLPGVLARLTGMLLSALSWLLSWILLSTTLSGALLLSLLLVLVLLGHKFLHEKRDAHCDRSFDLNVAVESQEPSRTAPRERSTKSLGTFRRGHRPRNGFLGEIASMPVIPRSRAQMTAAARRLTPILR